MTEFFPEVKRIAHEGPGTRNPLAFRHYDADAVILGRTMAEHLRFAVCYWHTFRGMGADMFGPGTMTRRYASPDPDTFAEGMMRAAFEFFTKLGVGFWCFHDVDLIVEADTFAETNKRFEKAVALAKKLQDETGVKLLWGTTNAFSHPRFMAGASTNPSPDVFAYAGAQVKRAMEATHELDGAGYVFWGGREGYDMLLNTDLRLETENLARFLHMAVEHKRRIGFKGALYIEPKPHEPTKHQYDFDSATVHAFLLRNGLADEFKINVEANHATLARHEFIHELAYCTANGILGSVDANRGDFLLGWDTDQFPTDVKECALAMHVILQGGGFTTGGLNFDAKLRRQSVDPVDLFHAHIGAMDAFALGLKVAARMIEDGAFAGFVKERYAGWDSDLGRRIREGRATLDDLHAHTLAHGEPALRSGRQEMLENMLNDYLHSVR